MLEPPENETAFWPAEDPPVEAYVDGELEPEARRRFERELALSSALAAEVELARSVRRGLRGLPRPSCPPEVTARVLDRVESRRGRWRRWLSALGLDGSRAFPGWAWAPALLLVAAVALAVSLAVPGDRSGEPSPAEIARAEAEIKLALAYVDRIATTTGTAVGRDGLGEHVARPFARSIAGALEPVPTEGKPR